MSINYVSDNEGKTIAVQIPIEQWILLTENYPDLDGLKEELPVFHKKLIDDRLQAIASNPNRLRPVEELFEELDKID